MGSTYLISIRRIIFTQKRCLHLASGTIKTPRIFLCRTVRSVALVWTMKAAGIRRGLAMNWPTPGRKHSRIM